MEEINRHYLYRPDMPLSLSLCWQKLEIHGFLTSVGTPTANGHIIVALLQAIHLSSKIATVHFPAHNKETDTISSGNVRTDSC